MNYQFTSAIIAFAAGERVSPTLVEGRSYDPYPALDAVGFGQRIQRLLNLYDWEVTQVMLNLLDSHDTPRLISLARGDKATIRLATLFQMTYPGAPSIYYGDEIGIRGTTDYEGPVNDPDARWPFPWHDREQWDMELFAFFKEAIALRHAHPVLRRGHFYQLYGEDNVFAFARRNESETLVIALNAGEEAAEVQVPIGAYFHDGAQLSLLFGQGRASAVENGEITLILPAREGVVLGVAS